MPGLYIHIPFCIQKCKYCDYISYAGEEAQISSYMKALELEIAQRAAEHAWGTFDTIFIGGGTPSLLSGTQIGDLLHSLRAHFQIADDAEITLECNPGTVNADKLSAYFLAGINRLSVGVQSMNDRQLFDVGRIHTREEALLCLRYAQIVGFQNINADIMLGLPGQSELDYLSTIQDLIGAGVRHISAYSLILHESTELYKLVTEKLLTLPPDDDVAIVQDIGTLYLEQCNYMQYEISNYALPGYQCRHNLNYWANGAYLGLGVAAHSAWRLPHKGGSPAWTRFENPGNLNDYMRAAGNPLSDTKLHVIPFEEEAFESVMLGLRQVNGLVLDAFEARFHMPFSSMYPVSIQQLSDNGWLLFENGRVRLTKRGLDMQNTALQYFLSETGE